MSAIKLPKLPLPDTYVWGTDEPNVYSAELLVAYAEQAVREALAAQVPVAWVIDARLGLSDPQFCSGNPEGIYKSLYVPLALIPEKDHG